MRLVKEGVDRARNDWANFRHLLQPLFIRRQDLFERAELVGQRQRRRFTDISYPERVEKPRVGRLFALLYGSDELLCRFLAEPLDELLTKSFDVECTPRSEVPDRFLALSGANQTADTTSDRLALASLDIRAADRAFGWQCHGAGVSRPAVHDYRHDLG